MGWRYRRSVKILPGVRLNFSKSGISTTLGVKGARYTIGKNGRRTVTAGTPFKGLYLTETYNKKKLKQQKKQAKIARKQYLTESDTNSFQCSEWTKHFSARNRKVALALCIFLGCFGVHRFYVGKEGTGIIYLLTFGIFGIGWIIDFVLILTNRFYDIQNRPLVL